ncbi:ABC transporter substrate-binding protein [Ideonella sp.]|uniref:ABC transporter substrate-binding protein n=1 Tax=Ideonella sp. TaxID=1929293 RepID=UPI0035B01954
MRRALLLAALLALATVRAGATVVLRDDGGHTHRLAAPPQRIVSLLPSLTESVCALGACDRLVGVDRYANWPEAVNRLPRLGGLEDAQVERIVALRPDVVLAARSARVVDRLRGLGLAVVVLDSETHADVRRTLQGLAQLLGRPEAGDRLWAAIEADLHAAAARVPAGWRGRRVYFEVASDPYAAGAASFIGQTLDRLGLGNVVPAAQGPFPKLNPEAVVRARPDVVMASARALRDMPGRPGWDGLAALQPVAGRPGRACGFEPAVYELVIRPGPRMGEAAHAIAACLAGLPPAP